MWEKKSVMIKIQFLEMGVNQTAENLILGGIANQNEIHLSLLSHLYYSQKIMILFVNKFLQLLLLQE